jgi:hypothetical protein
MAIDFECPCGKKLKSKDEYAGKRTKCPLCGAGLLVPQPAALVAAAAAAAVNRAANANLEPEAPLAIDMTESSVKIEPISSAAIETVAVLPVASPGAEPEDNGDSLRYKVLTSKDMGFFAKFDSGKLEDTLNQWSKQGWRVRSMLTITHASHSGVVNDLLVLLEK